MSSTGRIGRIHLGSGVVVLASLALHCGGDDGGASAPVSVPDGGTNPVPSTDAAGGGGASAKLDLLFVVDNSDSMGDKQALLAGAMTRLFERIDVKDIHVGALSSSIATGGDLCRLNNQDDRGRLINRVAQHDLSVIVPGSEKGFLSFGPGGSVPDRASLAERSAALIMGAGQAGCGFEAQLEALYRFAVEPDPPAFIAIDDLTHRASWSGIDEEILAQRSAFFRPDSVVAIVVLTDEDDGSIDPLAGGGLGWAYTTARFPGSLVERTTGTVRGTTAPRATSACSADPQSPDCASCGLGAICDPATSACQKIRSDAACTTAPAAAGSGPGYDGFYAQEQDGMNVRTVDMKRRFGLEARYPVHRYSSGLTRATLPDRAHAHPDVTLSNGGRVPAEYVDDPSCSNPLFSAALPTGATAELCKLAPGGRDPRKVLLGVIVGAPADDVAPAPDWTKLLGKDPTVGDLSGIDPHMLVSITPRPGLAGSDLALGDNGTDPVHGREWLTQGNNLQFACTFPLATPRDCTNLVGSCDCRPGLATNPPICGGAGNTTQVRAKAFPGPRVLTVARALGDQATVASICGGAQAYEAFVDSLAGRVSRASRF